MALGSIVVDLMMRTGAFEEGAANAERVAKRRAAAIDQAFSEMGRNVAVGVGVATAALAAMVANTTQQANDIINLARISGATADEFQRMAAAAKSVGVEQDQLGDIFKDFREKIGEFVATGGGEMKDFFEQVADKAGITADSFRNLSGPQALQLYVTSLEKAGLSTEQMSFYLESAANDATKLIPILQNGGAAAAELGDKAEAAGKIMSGSALASAKMLSDQISEIQSIFNAASNTIVLEMAPALVQVGKELTTVGQDGSKVEQIARGLASTFEFAASAGAGLAFIFEAVGTGLGGLGAAASQVIDRDFAGAGRTLDMLQSDLSNMALGYAEAINNIRNARVNLPPPPTVAVPGQTPPSPKGEGWNRANKEDKEGKKKADAAKKEAERLAEQAKKDAQALKDAGRTESEVLMDTLNKYQALLDKKLVTLEDYNAAATKLVEDSPLFKLSPKFKEAEKEREALADRLLALRRELMTDEERNVDALRAQLDLIGKINDASERGKLTGRALGGATAPAPEFGGLAPEIGGAFGELSKIDQAEEKLNEWYDKQLEMLKSFREERADLAASFDEEELALKAEHEAKLQLIESARHQAQLSAAASVFGNLADMTRQFAGEQSGIYKTMFALQKAAAIAQSIVAIQQGVAMAAANPWPLNLGAMASVAAATAGIISTIAGTSIQGARATGGPVSQNQTYLVGERGPELFVPNTNGAIVPNNKLGGDGGNITVNMIQNRERAGQTQERTTDGRREIDVFVADIMGDGPRAKAMRQAFGLQRRGV